MRYKRTAIFSAVDGSISQTSSLIDSNFFLTFSFQAVATGTIAGSFVLQFSNDLDTPTNWSNVPATTTSVSSAGVYFIPKIDVAYRWLQVVYTAVSGTGTLSGTYNAFSYS